MVRSASKMNLENIKATLDCSSEMLVNNVGMLDCKS